MSLCGLCFHRCDLREGQYGTCRARLCRNGKVVDANYGVITSLALDPVEKKPLRRFHPAATCAAPSVRTLRFPCLTALTC